MAPPGFDQNLGFLQRVENLTVEKLIAQAFLNRGHGEFTPPDTDLDRCGLFLREIPPIPALKFDQSFLITH
jgi:hypothetical protein